MCKISYSSNISATKPYIAFKVTLNWIKINFDTLCSESTFAKAYEKSNTLRINI